MLDIFAAAGLDKPDISVLSEEFLAEVRSLPQRNLAVEALRRLLQGEVNRRRGRNVVQARSFSEMLEQSILRYQNRAIEAAQVIEELIGLRAAVRPGGSRPVGGRSGDTARVLSIAQFGSTGSINAGVAAGIAVHTWIRRWAPPPT